MDPQSKFGNYRLVRVLGSGGMGEVWLASDLLADRLVALKFIKAHLMDTPEFRARFLNEARTLGRLEHDRIVTLYSVVEDAGQLALVLRFIEGATAGKGTSLADHIDAGGALTIDFVLSSARDILPALGFAHESGVIHRDIKPQNILLDRHERSFLTDFGIAVATSVARGTLTGPMIGSPHYMSPEQIQNSRQITVDKGGHRSDIYSYGVVLYEMLTGRVPFGGEGSREDGNEQTYQIQHAHCVQPPPSLSDINPAVSPSLEAVVLRCLAKNPDDRPQTCADLLEELNRAVAAGPSPASPVRVGTFVGREPPAIRSLTVPTIELRARSRKPGLQSLWSKLRSWAGKSVSAARTGETPKRASDIAKTPTLLEGGETRRSDTCVFTTEPDQMESGRLGSLEESSHRDSTRILQSPAGSAGKTPLAFRDEPDVALTVAKSFDRTFVGMSGILKTFPFRVGRASSDFDLFFDSAVSSVHFEIDFQGGQFTIQDLNSANGTFINGRLLKHMRQESLLFGAHILVGSNTKLIFGPSVIQDIPDLKGKVVGGRFSLVEKLHASATSAVYLANDLRMPRKLAVKILSPILARNAAYREQFSREAETASCIRHASICRVLDYGNSGTDDPDICDCLYICTEYLQGGSLAQRVDRGDVFELDRIRRWVTRICEALQHMHDLGITHSGLKPSAIVFDEDGDPFLSDFALATKLGDTGNQIVFGSPAFLAPEQWDGGDPAPATDQYSLGILIYLLISGCLPYEGQDEPEIRKRNFLRGAVPAHEMAAQNARPAVPNAVSAVIRKAMSVNPADRFENISEFGSAFKSVREDAPNPNRTVSVFISYQRAVSSSWAVLLQRCLKSEYDIHVFVDSQQADKAGRFPPRLQQRIETSDVFVCLLAESTLNSDWVKREIEIAHAANKPMIPVFQESFRHPESLQSLEPCVQELLTFEGVYLFDLRNLYMDAAIRQLSECIHQLANSG